MKENMYCAYNQAIKALKQNDIPVGAVITYNGKIIAKAHNNRHSKQTVLGHAEIVAINKAQRKLKKWHLNDCEMFVTLEPCTMCEQVIRESRISKIYFLLEKTSKNSTYSQTKFIKLPSNLAENYNNVLSSFFDNKR